jgi:membrane associated rhomboid family serine protease
MGAITLIIIIANVFFSYKGFQDHAFYNRYAFDLDKVVINKEYIRLVSSGFLHVNWQHLLFNMLSLFFFSSGLETYIGVIPFLIIYFSSLIGGNLFSMLIHRNHEQYGSVGASGAVCGIIFASIALFPGMLISFFFIISLPAWIYGLLYVLYSIYGIRSRRDNVGHEAHLAGALIGMVIAILIEPSTVAINYLPILAVSVPTLVFIYIILKKPHLLLVDNNYFKKHQQFYNIDHRYNAQKADKQKEIDRLLEKIHKKGMSSLTKKEKEILADYSRTVK